MDLIKFTEELQQLSTLVANPSLLDQISGSQATPTMHLLNFANNYLEDSEIYCQIGCPTPANLVAALVSRYDIMAYAIDDSPTLAERINPTLIDCHLDDQVLLCDRGFADFFADLQEVNNEDKIGVCFCNNLPDSESLSNALFLVRDFLAKQAVIIVETESSEASDRVIQDFLANNSSSHLVVQLTITTTLDKQSQVKVHPDISLQILAWQAEK